MKETPDTYYGSEGVHNLQVAIRLAKTVSRSIFAIRIKLGIELMRQLEHMRFEGQIHVTGRNDGYDTLVQEKNKRA
jgi:hypothetical protein